MRVSPVVVRNAQPRATDFAALSGIQPSLVLAFGSVAKLQQGATAIAEAFPQAHRVGCSTAGEISQDGVADETLVVTALRLDTSQGEQVSTVLASMEDSFAAGERLAFALPKAGLRAILIFGQDVSNERLTCVGLYGEALVFSHGSFGGWSPFGPARKVTRCENNVLFELDGEPALTVYKRYLGEDARGLPASGLLFPFAMLGRDYSERGLIRTANRSFTLAGEIDPNDHLKLMQASTDALVDGAQAAAQAAKSMLDEEIETVSEVFGQGVTMAGLYSYGEISPFVPAAQCKLHNQTMTITYISESV